MALYKRGKTWWYEFVIAEKRIRESSKSSRKTVAAEAERNRRLELERALAGMPADKRQDRIKSVKEIISEYRAHYHLNHRPQSVQFSSNRLAHVERLLSNVLLSDLTEKRIREYIRMRLGEQVSGRTINMELGELSRAIGRPWSILWPKVRKLEEKKDIGKALTLGEEKRLLQSADARRSPVFSCFIRIALSTGMRSGEIINLTWSQIDFVGRIVTVGRAKTSSGTGRQIPMSESLERVLSAHAKWFCRHIWDAEGRALPFPVRQADANDPSRPMTTVKTIWNAVRKAAMVQCRLHDLRHTVATKLAEAGTPESTMLALLGHMSRMMLERYSHIRLAAKRTAMDSFHLPMTLRT